MFDPASGEVLICDNDNVALAVLLFHLWVWHHPLHGEMEYQFRSWDLPAKRQVYGVDAVFIFDPVDRRNRLPNDPDYTTAARRWGFCPASLRQLFTRAFTVGLREPARRVTEGEWQAAFLQLKDGVTPCPHCGAENLWEPGLTAPPCWHCRRPVPVPPRLVFAHGSGGHALLLNRDVRILQRHVDPTVGEELAAAVLGQVVQNPANPKVWGVRNLSAAPWVATFADGTTREVPPHTAVPINVGLTLQIAGCRAEVVES